MSSHIPAVVEKHLDAVEILRDDKLLLASSNLTGRYWNGSIFCFARIEDAPNVEKCSTGIETLSGIGDIRCFMEDKFVVGMDSGALELYEIMECNVPQFNILSHSCEHDDIVSSLSVNCNESRLVSAGYDKCVKVWDLESFTSIATYRPVHSSIVWQVSCSTTDPELLISCSQDGKVLLLDLRLPKPAMGICSEPLHHIPTAVAWKPCSDASFAVGYDDGSIAIRDVRNPKESRSYTGHGRSIHRLCFSKTNPNWLASCADETEVIVTDIGKTAPNTEYLNGAHEDFVRGLTWTSDNNLVTCGWDKHVFRHAVNSIDMDVASGSVCRNADVSVE